MSDVTPVNSAQAEPSFDMAAIRERLQRMLEGLNRGSVDETARKLARLAGELNRNVAAQELGTMLPAPALVVLGNDKDTAMPCVEPKTVEANSLVSITEDAETGTKVSALLDRNRALEGQLLAYEQALTADKLVSVFVSGIIKVGHTIDDESVTFHRDKHSGHNALHQLSQAVVDALTQHVLASAPPVGDGRANRAIAVIQRAYGFTVKSDGELMALTAGDMGYEGTGLKIDMTGWVEESSLAVQENGSDAVGWRWRSAKSVHWTYVDGHPSDDQRAWLTRFGHRFQHLFTEPQTLGATLPDGEKLLTIARATGLREAMHGVRATEAREMLSTFVREVANAEAAMPPA
ncbi:hypothetical protein [Ralstonia pseudosolanacearum]|uniref:hypothetical protein n=1 Tax=Ralstonia pseudosolanacearum TaxID=1310165 RepID=UPI003CEA93A4